MAGDAAGRPGWCRMPVVVPALDEGRTPSGAKTPPLSLMLRCNVDTEHYPVGRVLRELLPIHIIVRRCTITVRRRTGAALA